MTTVADDCVREALALLAVFQFTERGHSLLRGASFVLVAQEAIAQLRGPRILIPVDVPAPLQPAAA